MRTILLIISLGVVLSSCAAKYELTVTASTGGSVSVDPAVGSYKAGTVITLTATAQSGYSFTGWGNVNSYTSDSALSRAIEIIMPDEDLSVSAGFTVPGKGWTFMVYMAGDNSLSSYVYGDLNEIESGLYYAVQAGNDAIYSDVKVLVLTDRSGSSDTLLYLAAPDSSSLSIASSIIEDDVYGIGSELNMADPDTLKKFISYGLAKYPSEHNALILWNHGGGVKSIDYGTPESKHICGDGNDYLYLNEVQTAISSAVGNSALDIIGMDACIMGEVETAYEMRDLADYFVASMANEWTEGWGYRYIFDNFDTAGNPPEPDVMADIFVSQYQESTSGRNIAFPNTMTAVSTAHLENLKTAIDELAYAIQAFGSDSQAEFQNIRNNSVFYYTPRPLGKPFVDGDYDNPENNNDDDYEEELVAIPYYDLFDFCTNISNSIIYDGSPVTVKVDAVLAALDDAVVACYGNSSAVDSYYSSVRNPLNLNYFETTDASANRGLSISIPHGELTWQGSTGIYSHYAYDWWYTSEVLTSKIPPGGLDFCTYDDDEKVETWRELFEAWYDNYPSINSGDGYTPGNY